MSVTTCTAERILTAAREFTPIYYQRYINSANERFISSAATCLPRH